MAQITIVYSTKWEARAEKVENNELSYLARLFPSKTLQQIKDALRVAGPFRSDVFRYLQKGILSRL